MSVRACTFNVRYDEPADGPDGWPHRREAVVETVRTVDPDLLGLQEPLQHQVTYLRSRLPEYDWYGVGRDDGPRPERDPVAWRAERFEALDRETRWLSPTPDRRGSRGWDGARARFATRVRLRDRETGHRLTVYCVHLDHEGERARREGARLLAGWTGDDDRPVVLADLNAPPDSAPYGTLTGPLRDARVAATEVRGPAGTAHDFDGRPGERLDYVFVGGDLAVRTCETVTASPRGRYPSDHFPVAADLRTE